MALCPKCDRHLNRFSDVLTLPPHNGRSPDCHKNLTISYRPNF
ncbi:hypothetical protein CKA32_002541 [Geitlerinema sp. FC II]|nr:hypothetical protein CKA32_002541 [Geitlerinema sp. FC II]